MGSITSATTLSATESARKVSAAPPTMSSAKVTTLKTSLSWSPSSRMATESQPTSATCSRRASIHQAALHFASHGEQAACGLARTRVHPCEARPGDQRRLERRAKEPSTLLAVPKFGPRHARTPAFGGTDIRPCQTSSSERRQQRRLAGVCTTAASGRAAQVRRTGQRRPAACLSPSVTGRRSRRQIRACEQRRRRLSSTDNPRSLHENEPRKASLHARGSTDRARQTNGMAGGEQARVVT